MAAMTVINYFQRTKNSLPSIDIKTIKFTGKVLLEYLKILIV